MDKRLTITVSAELHDRVKTRAAQLNLTIKDYLIRIIINNLSFSDTSLQDFANYTHEELRQIATQDPVESKRETAKRFLAMRILQ